MTDVDSTSHHKIVVGIDGSDTSLQALGWGAEQAEHTGALLEVVTTWEWPISYGVPLALPNNYNPAGEAEGLLEQALEPVRAAHPGVEINPVVIEGRAAPVLIELSRGANLLVVGSRGHGEFAGMLLGSVSQHCVTGAHCPVLVLRDRAPE